MKYIVNYPKKKIKLLNNLSVSAIFLLLTVINKRSGRLTAQCFVCFFPQSLWCRRSH